MLLSPPLWRPIYVACFDKQDETGVAGVTEYGVNSFGTVMVPSIRGVCTKRA